MPAKIQVIFYSTCAHIWKFAEAVAEEGRHVPGSNVKVLGLGIMRIIHPVNVGGALTAGAFRLANPDDK